MVNFLSPRHAKASLHFRPLFAIHPERPIMASLLPRHAALAFLLLMLAAGPLCAAEPVEVEVSGIEGAPLKNLQEVLALPYGLVRDGKVDRLWLDRFARQAGEKGRRALEPFGYYHAQVTASVREVRAGGYLLSVQVVPGEPVRVSRVELEIKGPGAGEAPLRRLAASFPLTKGSVLVEPDYERAKGGLKGAAVALGYLDADFTRHEIRIAPGEREARIFLTMQTGARYFFDDVRIEGAPEYPQPYLRRFIAFKRGEVFSYEKIGETQLNFSNAERFKEVIITPQKEQAKDLHVPVLVKLTPGARHSIRPGVGYGTDTGARVSVRYRDLNVFRAGNDLDMNLYIAQLLQGFAARYTIPSSRDLKSSTSLQLNLQREDVTTYTSRLAALEFDYNRSLGHGELATPYLKVQYEGFDIAGESSSSRLVLPGFRFTKTDYDSLIRPTRGYHYSLDLRGAHPYLGSDAALAQFIAYGNAVVPLPERLSLHLRSQFGASLLADPLADFPPSIRFFTGGDQSVRAFSYQSLGPKNSQGEVVGGRDLLVGSVELERAIQKNWGVSLFTDVGNAFNTFSGLRLYQGAGIGLHYYSPVGGLHFDLAKRMQTSKQIYYIHFTVGFQL